MSGSSLPAVGADTPLHQYAERRRAAIDDALANYLRDLPAGCPPRLREAMAHSLLAPGKRLRPLLVLMAAEACGFHWERALPAACAVEMIHTYSLIHDDLPAMDDDDLRRGRPTCHKAFGEALAILAGDALLALAFEVLAQGIEPPEVAARCCLALAQAAGPARLVGGQVDDLAAETSGGTYNTLVGIHERKTGAMFHVSLQLGGLVAQADDQRRAALEAYGACLGLAFQITDDLLDARGDAHQAGKRTGKDAGRNKLTYPALLGWDESRARAQSLVDDAVAALASWGAAAGHLQALARSVLERNR